MDEQAIYRAVGRRLRQRRRSLDLTLGDMAKACRVCFQQVQKYESGATAISVAKLVILADVLQVPVSFLLDNLNLETRPHADAVIEPFRATAA